MSQPIQRGAGPDPPQTRWRVEGGWEGVCGWDGEKVSCGPIQGCGARSPHRWAEGWKLGGRWVRESVGVAGEPM